MFGYYVPQLSPWHDISRTLRRPIHYCINLWHRLRVMRVNECRSWVYEPRRSKIGSSKEIVGECKYRIISHYIHKQKRSLQKSRSKQASEHHRTNIQSQVPLGNSLRAAEDREGWKGIVATSSMVPRWPPRLRDWDEMRSHSGIIRVWYNDWLYNKCRSQWHISWSSDFTSLSNVFSSWIL